MLGRNEGWIDIPFLGSWAGRRAGPHQAGSQKIDGSFWNGRAPRSCRWAFLECTRQPWHCLDAGRMARRVAEAAIVPNWRWLRPLAGCARCA